MTSSIHVYDCGCTYVSQDGTYPTKCDDHPKAEESLSLFAGTLQCINLAQGWLKPTAKMGLRRVHFSENFQKASEQCRGDCWFHGWTVISAHAGATHVRGLVEDRKGYVHVLSTSDFRFIDHPPVGRDQVVASMSIPPGDLP